MMVTILGSFLAAPLDQPGAGLPRRVPEGIPLPLLVGAAVLVLVVLAASLAA